MRSYQHKSKLDYIFTDNTSIFDFNSKTLFAFSDHLALHVDFIHKTSNKNNIIWKLNTKLLDNPKFSEKLANSDLNQFENWDELKFYIRNILITTKSLSTNPWKKLEKITKDIDKLEASLKKFPAANDITTIISIKEEERNKLSQQCSDYWQIRSKAKWIENGKKSIKYFFQ